ESNFWNRLIFGAVSIGMIVYQVDSAQKQKREKDRGKSGDGGGQDLNNRDHTHTVNNNQIYNNQTYNNTYIIGSSTQEKAKPHTNSTAHQTTSTNNQFIDESQNQTIDADWQNKYCPLISDLLNGLNEIKLPEEWTRDDWLSKTEREFALSYFYRDQEAQKEIRLHTRGVPSWEDVRKSPVQYLLVAALSALVGYLFVKVVGVDVISRGSSSLAKGLQNCMDIFGYSISAGIVLFLLYILLSSVRAVKLW
ncbi:MAG: hypothetical protein VXZ72_00425, partial [Chlamydiota bacterium]|nr:hypothetical protein [Chlamydiota bacterium]